MQFRAPYEEIDSLNTSLWGTVKHVDWAAMSQYGTKQIQDIEVFDISMHKGLSKLLFLLQQRNEITKFGHERFRKATLHSCCLLW